MKRLSTKRQLNPEQSMTKTLHFLSPHPALPEETILNFFPTESQINSGLHLENTNVTAL